MADNYVQFSEVYSIKPEAEHWLKNEVMDPASPSNMKNSMENEGSWPDFNWEIVDGCLWVWDDAGYGNLDNVAIALQEYLAKYEPDRSVSLQWAETCSKPRAGEFGGGAAFITAKSVKWLNTGTWCQLQRRRFEQYKSLKRRKGKKR